MPSHARLIVPESQASEVAVKLLGVGGGVPVHGPGAITAGVGPATAEVPTYGKPVDVTV